jgi:hypothetical protein
MVGAMQVTFTRTGPRTYGIAADRGGGSVVHMPTGPGFDPWLPHDLVHFVVERHVGIVHGVFGQLAAGGTAAWPARRGGRRPFADAFERDEVAAVPTALLAELDDAASGWHGSTSARR